MDKHRIKARIQAMSFTVNIKPQLNPLWNSTEELFDKNINRKRQDNGFESGVPVG